MKLAALVPGSSVVDDLAFFAQLSAPGSGRRVPARHGQNGFEPTLIDAMRCVLKEWRIVGEVTMIKGIDLPDFVQLTIRALHTSLRVGDTVFRARHAVAVDTRCFGPRCRMRRTGRCCSGSVVICFTHRASTRSSS